MSVDIGYDGRLATARSPPYTYGLWKEASLWCMKVPKEPSAVHNGLGPRLGLPETPLCSAPEDRAQLASELPP